MQPENKGGDEEIREGLMEVLQGNPEVLMSILENAVSLGDKALLRDIIDAAFILYAQKEADLPGGREFWEKMRANIASQMASSSGHTPPDDKARRRRAMEVFTKALFEYGSTHPELKRKLDEAERKRLSPFFPAALVTTSDAASPAAPTYVPSTSASSQSQSSATPPQTAGVLATKPASADSGKGRKPTTGGGLGDELEPQPLQRRGARGHAAATTVSTTAHAPSAQSKGGTPAPAPSPDEIDAAFTVGKAEKGAQASRAENTAKQLHEQIPLPEATVIPPLKGADKTGAHSLSFVKAPDASPPGAMPVHAGAGDGAAVAELRALLDKKEAELRGKDALLREYEGDMEKIYDQLKAREGSPEAKSLEDRLAIQEEEARMAREDLAKMEKKYRENLDLLKGEARDRGTLHRKLETLEAELGRAEARMKEDEKRLSETRRELEAKEAELRKLDERLHVAELELARKEEEIKLAMQHLREEESERRKVLESLRKEAREKAQMEHRLMKRETELARLETRLVDEEKRLEALKGSQAVSEEEGIKLGAALRKREEDARRLEGEVADKISKLKREEETLRHSIGEMKEGLRERERAEAALKRRNELLVEAEARLRDKEARLTRELVEMERARAGITEREKELIVKEMEGPKTPPAPVLPNEERALRRDDILDLLSKRVKKDGKK